MKPETKRRPFHDTRWPRLLAAIAITLTVLAVFIFAYIVLNARPKRNIQEAEIVTDYIRALGYTSDGKYSVYDLQGELEDLTYVTRTGVVYKPDDLPTRMRFIHPEDVNKGTYTCGFVCKDKHDHIVGLNPAWAKLYKKQ